MSKREVIEQKAEALILPVLEASGVRIVDTEYVREGSDFYLRYYIDKEGGVNIQDCETVSRAVSALLDEADLIEDAYILEVSSPGLGRPLKKDRDYDRNIGREVEIRLFKAENGQKELTGTLSAYTKETVTVQCGDTAYTLDRKNISKISEYVDWSM